jgi:hypothetical protein
MGLLIVHRHMDLHLPVALGSETYIMHVRISFFFTLWQNHYRKKSSAIEVFSSKTIVK